MSVQTTEKYLGCKQKLRIGVNGHRGIAPNQAHWQFGVYPAKFGFVHS